MARYVGPRLRIPASLNEDIYFRNWSKKFRPEAVRQTQKYVLINSIYPSLYFLPFFPSFFVRSIFFPYFPHSILSNFSFFSVSFGASLSLSASSLISFFLSLAGTTVEARLIRQQAFSSL
jgi:hypothetical protein